MSLTANHDCPCLLGRQVDQFEELEKSTEEAHQDPCRLVQLVNQFRAGVRNLRSCQTSWQGAGDDDLSLLARQTGVPATQGGRGEAKNVGKGKAPRPIVGVGSRVTKTSLCGRLQYRLKCLNALLMIGKDHCVGKRIIEPGVGGEVYVFGPPGEFLGLALGLLR